MMSISGPYDWWLFPEIRIDLWSRVWRRAGGRTETLRAKSLCRWWAKRARSCINVTSAMPFKWKLDQLSWHSKNIFHHERIILSVTRANCRTLMLADDHGLRMALYCRHTYIRGFDPVRTLTRGVVLIIIRNIRFMVRVYCRITNLLLRFRCFRYSTAYPGIVSLEFHGLFRFT